MNSQYKDDLTHIRNMMEQSSRFVSLSGLSGIFAGVFALIGAAVAYYLMQEHHIQILEGQRQAYSSEFILQLGLTALAVLFLSIVFGVYFTIRKSKTKKLPVWNKVSQNLLLNLAIPLLVGGIFCVALIYYNSLFLLVPSMLTFYGLALVNVAKYTYGDVRWLGYLEILLGCIALFFTERGLLLWAIGFGVLHIIYGSLMFNKYDK